jgi:hypothetical protein
MMRLSDIEAWVLGVADQQKCKQPCEDSRVEIKAKWPDPQKAARQIAGHGNAARGENILWIIGIDESEGIIGADNTEVANWLPTVKGCFDGVFPELVDLNVRVDEKMVVALVFSTDRAPFVVKNNAFGKPDSGPVELEVPWREGRRTRSARREDLVRLLVPISRQPSVEVLGATVTVTEPSRESSPSSCNWNANLHLYIAPSDQNRLVIPFHKCQIVVAVGEERTSIDKEIRITPPLYFRGRHSPGSIFEPDSITISSTNSEVIIDGPGRLHVTTYLKAPRPKAITAPEVMLSLRMCPVRAEKPLVIETNLRRVEQSGTEKFMAKWECGKD